MTDYTIYRRGVIEQTLIVRGAKSKAHAIRMAQDPENHNVDTETPVVESCNWELDHWHHTASWLVAPEASEEGNTCPRCKGTGEQTPDHPSQFNPIQCRLCHGTGKASVSETQEKADG